MAGGLYSPSAGDVLTAANATDYWSKQVVIICTSGTRPTAREGMVIYQTDTDTLLVYVTAWCEITPYNATSGTTTVSTTTSTSYTSTLADGLTTAVTVTTGTEALVTFTVNPVYQTTGGIGYVAYAVSGATTVAASDSYAIVESSTTMGLSGALAYPKTALTAGANTFTLRYRTTANTLNVGLRGLSVVGIPT